MIDEYMITLLFFTLSFIISLAVLFTWPGKIHVYVGSNKHDSFEEFARWVEKNKPDLIYLSGGKNATLSKMLTGYNVVDEKDADNNFDGKTIVEGTGNMDAADKLFKGRKYLYGIISSEPDKKYQVMTEERFVS